jgi:phosphopantothenoylcysteine decarboxylase / phosphopantothenate---cysteine ligase
VSGGDRLDFPHRLAAEGVTGMGEARSILLIVGGGIAAYKAPELVRAFRKRGLGVRVILTDAGSQFTTALSLASVSGQEVHGALFDLTAEAKMGHIELSRSADLVVVAPATADLMAKAANGLANDLASTALLATDKPVLMAPAMNVRMWEHPATQRNLATLRADGLHFVGPDSGEMACGEFGPGRMAEPDAIVDAALAVLDAAGTTAPGTTALPPPARLLAPVQARAPQDSPLSGRHVLITAGPTYEPLDPVRFLGNRSSGKQGYALASALAALGARVTLVSGPTALNDPPGVTTVRVETARQMVAACEAALPADVFAAVAAVADWRPATEAPDKLKLKDSGAKAGAVTLPLAENPDILATLARPGPRRPALVIGFAAETQAVESYAIAKRVRKQADWIVANDVSGDVMGGDFNEALLITAKGTEPLLRMSKAELAATLAQRIAAHLPRSSP